MELEKARARLFRSLDSVLDVAEKKFSIDNKRDAPRMKWGRLIVNAVKVYGSLLKDEELELRIQALEDAVQEGIIVPRQEQPHKRR